MSEFEIFLTKAREKQYNKLKIAKINVENFGEVEFIRPSTKELLEYTNKVGRASKFKVTKENETIIEDTDMIAVLEAAQELVYNSCPSLQKKEFREELFPTIGDNYLIPTELFGIDETMNLAEKISSIFNGKNIKEQINEDVKN